MKRIVNSKRVGQFEFRVASYLFDDPKTMEHPSYVIDLWYPNTYYGKIDQFHKVEGEYYVSNEKPHCYMSKSIFEKPELCYSIAEFNYNEKEACYEFSWIGDRPLKVINNNELNPVFNNLIEYGFHELSDSDECSLNEDMIVSADLKLHIDGIVINAKKNHKAVMEALTSNLGLRNIGFEYEIDNLQYE